MSNAINLQERAQGCISDALYGVTTYDAEELRESVMDDHVATDAENACIYTHDCREIIARYEREFGADATDICDGGTTYKPSEWEAAMISYAGAVAYTAMQSYASDALDEIEKAATALAEAVADNCSAIHIGTDCPHGWARHDREDADGTHYWEPAELEGMKAIARQVNGVWLSCTWMPASVTPAT